MKSETEELGGEAARAQNEQLRDHNVVLVWILIVQLLVLILLAGALWRAAGSIAFFVTPECLEERAPATKPRKTTSIPFREVDLAGVDKRVTTARGAAVCPAARGADLL